MSDRLKEKLKRRVKDSRLKYNEHRSFDSPKFFPDDLQRILDAIDAAFAEPDGDKGTKIDWNKPSSIPLFRCTVCGREGSVARCCGKRTRVPLNDAARAEVGQQWSPNFGFTETETETPEQMVGGTRNLHNPSKYEGLIDCERCGTRHQVVEGSRSHVIHWDGNGMHCSEPKCEINHESETYQECPHWCDMLCEQGHSCPNAEPDADTAPADLNRQRCVNLEWRVKEIEQRVSKLESKIKEGE